MITFKYVTERAGQTDMLDKFLNDYGKKGYRLCQLGVSGIGIQNGGFVVVMEKVVEVEIPEKIKVECTDGSYVGDSYTKGEMEIFYLVGDPEDEPKKEIAGEGDVCIVYKYDYHDDEDGLDKTGYGMVVVRGTDDLNEAQEFFRETCKRKNSVIINRYFWKATDERVEDPTIHYISTEDEANAMGREGDICIDYKFKSVVDSRWKEGLAIVKGTKDLKEARYLFNSTYSGDIKGDRVINRIYFWRGVSYVSSQRMSDVEIVKFIRDGDIFIRYSYEVPGVQGRIQSNGFARGRKLCVEDAEKIFLKECLDKNPIIHVAWFWRDKGNDTK